MIHDKRDLGTFIPSFLDDYGLECDEFRVYARIARRAGSGKCFESIRGIAEGCKIGELRAREIVHFLALAQMIAILPNSGKSNEYVLTSHSSWAESDQLEGLRRKTRRHRERCRGSMREISRSSHSSKKPPAKKKHLRHKEFVFKRDNFKCIYCQSLDDLTLDHVIPRSRGGSHDPGNLVTACRLCNSSKNGRTPQEWKGGQGQ